MHEESIKNIKHFKPNRNGYQILTPSGYRDFAGVAYMGMKKTIRIEFDNDGWLECSSNHILIDSEGNEINAIDLAIGDKIRSKNGPVSVVNVENKGEESVYDVIDVDGGSLYYSNNILSHNCEFVTFEETLVSPLILKGIHGEEPMEIVGRTRWYTEPKPNRIYIAALDPSMGTGSDNAAITVWMLPEFEQIAEWTHNNTDVSGQIAVFSEILSRLYNLIMSNPEQDGNPEIYFTIENNSLGEAAIKVIEDTGEDIFPGDFVHEPKKKRKGFTTTYRSKTEACARLKNLVEAGKIQIKSKLLVNELKTFIRSNHSVGSRTVYQAKPPNRDDIISSLLVNLRMLDVIKFWDDEVYDRLANTIDVEESDDPMPLIV